MICEKLDRLRPTKNCYTDQITFVEDRPGHDFRYSIDASKIKNKLGWTPRYSLEEGLDHTVNWYLQNTEWLDLLLNRNGVGERLGRKPRAGRKAA